MAYVQYSATSMGLFTVCITCRCLSFREAVSMCVSGGHFFLVIISVCYIVTCLCSSRWPQFSHWIINWTNSFTLSFGNATTMCGAEIHNVTGNQGWKLTGVWVKKKTKMIENTPKICAMINMNGRQNEYWTASPLRPKSGSNTLLHMRFLLQLFSLLRLNRCVYEDTCKDGDSDA